MNRIFGTLLAGLLALVCSAQLSSVSAQCTGVLAAGAFCGNPTGSSAPAKPTTAMPGTSSTFIQDGTSPTTRTMQAKVREIVSPEDFGADPTGVADSSTAFTRAIATGKVIRCGTPGGTYAMHDVATTDLTNIECYGNVFDVSAGVTSYGIKLTGYKSSIAGPQIKDSSNRTKTTTSLSSTANSSDTSISVSSASNFAVGKIVAITLDATTTAGFHKHLVTEVISVSGTTIGILDPIPSTATSGNVVELVIPTVLIDQSVPAGQLKDVLFAGNPFMLRIVNSTSDTSKTFLTNIQTTTGSTPSVLGFMLDTNVNTVILSGYRSIENAGSSAPGYLGYWQESRNATKASGGHDFVNFGIEAWENNVKLQAATGSKYDLLVDDGADNNIVIDNGSNNLDFTRLWSGSAGNGTGIFIKSSSTNIAIASLDTPGNSVCDLNVESGSHVRVNMMSWNNFASSGGSATCGTGSINDQENLYLSGSVGKQSAFVVPVTGAVNSLGIRGNTTGNAVQLYAQGGDANIDLNIMAAGNRSIFFYTEGPISGSPVAQFGITDTANAVNTFRATGGANGVAPKLVVASSDSETNVPANIVPLGSSHLQENGTNVVLYTRSVNTTSPLGGGGALSSDLTLTCTTCLVSGGALGTPSSGVATNLTGTASGLTAGASTLGTLTAKSDGSTYFPVLAPSSSSGTAALGVSSNLTWVPSTGVLTTNGRYVSSNGTVSAPSFTFSGDTTSGIFLSSSGVMRTTAGGTAVSELGVNAGVPYLALQSTGAFYFATFGSAINATISYAGSSGAIQVGTTANNALGSVTAATFIGALTGNATNITASSNTSLTSLANLATVGTLTSGVINWSGAITTSAKITTSNTTDGGVTLPGFTMQGDGTNAYLKSTTISMTVGGGSTGNGITIPSNGKVQMPSLGNSSTGHAVCYNTGTGELTYSATGGC